MYNNVTSQSRHAGIPLHRDTAPTPSQIHRYLWRWKIGAAILPPRPNAMCVPYIKNSQEE